MRKQRSGLLAFGLLWLLVSCQSLELRVVTPGATERMRLREGRLRTSLTVSDSFFRTWRVVSATGFHPSTPTMLTVEFARQGKLLYGSNKSAGGCCTPNNFTLVGNQLKLVNVDPVPSFCANVGCLATVLVVGDAWQIDRVDATGLVLKGENRTITFEPVD